VANLNLIEDELVTCVSLRLKVLGNSGPDRMKEASSNNGKHRRGCGKGPGSSSHGGNHGGGDTSDRGGSSTGHGGTGDVEKDECRYCGKRGHWARECRKKKRDEEAKAA
jgi:hypothetical protein